MDTRLAKVTRARLKSNLKKVFPEFRKYNIEKPKGWQLNAYEYLLADDLGFFLCMTTEDHYDAFRIVAGWSENKSFPSGSAGRYPKDFPEYGIKKDTAKNGKMCFPVHALWDPERVSKHKPYWPLLLPLCWRKDRIMDRDVELPPEIVEAIEKSVDEAMATTVKYLIPYFQEVAREHGYEYVRPAS
jgi:hypothetical protein